MKRKLTDWLEKNLKCKLSDEKTKIMNMIKIKAHFLGFAIYFRNQKVVRIKEKIYFVKSINERSYMCLVRIYTLLKL